MNNFLKYTPEYIYISIEFNNCNLNLIAELLKKFNNINKFSRIFIVEADETQIIRVFEYDFYNKPMLNSQDTSFRLACPILVSNYLLSTAMYGDSVTYKEIERCCKKCRENTGGTSIHDFLVETIISLKKNQTIDKITNDFETYFPNEGYYNNKSFKSGYYPTYVYFDIIKRIAPLI